jgi:hypothetical protein
MTTNDNILRRFRPGAPSRGVIAAHAGISWGGALAEAGARRATQVPARAYGASGMTPVGCACGASGMTTAQQRGSEP